VAEIVWIVKEVKRQIKRLQNLPDLIKGFFKDPMLAYINDIGVSIYFLVVLP